MSEYYLDIKGKTMGPLTLEKVGELYSRRAIGDTTLYTQPGASEWRPLSKLLGEVSEQWTSSASIPKTPPTSLPAESAQRSPDRATFHPQTVGIGATESALPLYPPSSASNRPRIVLNEITFGDVGRVVFFVYVWMAIFALASFVIWSIARAIFNSSGLY